MKLVLPFFAGAMAQNSFLPPQSYNAQPAAAPAPMGGMDPMMMMLMLGDSKSSTKDLLPLMMMSGGMGGAGAGGMDPMMMMLLLGDDSSSSSSSSSMKDLLPLMMMGGMGGAGAQGGMNPLLMMSLLEDSCEVKNAKTKALTATDAEKKDVARGVKCVDTASKVIACGDVGDGSYIDYDFIKCESGSSGMSDLLPLMMMGGGMGGDAAGMNSMLPLMLMGDSSSGMSDLLPLMMMGGNGAAGMDPMMMMLMLDSDDTTTKTGCDSKFKINHAFKADKTKITAASDIRAAVVADGILGAVKSTWETEYAACLTKATSEGSTSSSNSLKDLLPLMMMGGMNGQAGAGGMDPMMMMMLMD